MPFYEYECQGCGEHHEAMQKMSDAPLRKCPACGKPRLVRLVSAPLFRLKGAGWYETDFKSEKEAKRNLHGEEKAEKVEPAKDAKADPAAAPGKAEPADAKAAAPAEAAKPPAKAAAPKTATRRKLRRRPAGKSARRR